MWEFEGQGLAGLDGDMVCEDSAVDCGQWKKRLVCRRWVIVGLVGWGCVEFSAKKRRIS